MTHCTDEGEIWQGTVVHVCYSYNIFSVYWWFHAITCF